MYNTCAFVTATPSPQKKGPPPLWPAENCSFKSQSCREKAHTCARTSKTNTTSIFLSPYISSHFIIEYIVLFPPWSIILRGTFCTVKGGGWVVRLGIIIPKYMSLNTNPSIEYTIGYTCAWYRIPLRDHLLKSGWGARLYNMCGFESHTISQSEYKVSFLYLNMDSCILQKLHFPHTKSSSGSDISSFYTLIMWTETKTRQLINNNLCNNLPVTRK